MRKVLIAALLLSAAAAASAEVQRKTLLAADGTLYSVATGPTSELGVQDLTSQDFAVTWSSVAQDGTAASGLVKGAGSLNPKTSLNLTLDEPTGTLVVLWREESTILNAIRVAFGKGGSWTIADLLPTIGFPHAYNPQMLLTHETTHELDADGADVYTTHSILSVIWWEENGIAQARYASIFLDETADASHVAVYNLPELVNDAGRTSLEDVPRGAYAFPTLQPEGVDGVLLASFATLSSDHQYVVRMSYPTELGQPSKDNTTWLRRRIPVVGIASMGPISAVPSMDMASVHTVVGSSYKPTLYWRDDVSLHYIRFDGTLWSDVRTITFSDDMSYAQAAALVEEMARRN